MKECIVVFDDEQGLCVPYGLDPDCEGALTPADGEEIPVAVFPGRRAARKAITVSKRLALLRKAQGKPENTDFTEAVSFVRVYPVARAGE